MARDKYILGDFWSTLGDSVTAASGHPAADNLSALVSLYKKSGPFSEYWWSYVRWKLNKEQDCF
jgi:hypothetical protein